MHVHYYVLLAALLISQSKHTRMVLSVYIIAWERLINCEEQLVKQSWIYQTKF